MAVGKRQFQVPVRVAVVLVVMILPACTSTSARVGDGERLYRMFHGRFYVTLLFRIFYVCFSLLCVATKIRVCV